MILLSFLVGVLITLVVLRLKKIKPPPADAPMPTDLVSPLGPDGMVHCRYEVKKVPLSECVITMNWGIVHIPKHGPIHTTMGTVTGSDYK